VQGLVRGCLLGALAGVYAQAPITAKNRGALAPPDVKPRGVKRGDSLSPLMVCLLIFLCMFVGWLSSCPTLKCVWDQDSCGCCWTRVN
jgi:hypothetical protein